VVAVAFRAGEGMVGDTLARAASRFPSAARRARSSRLCETWSGSRSGSRSVL